MGWAPPHLTDPLAGPGGSSLAAHGKVRSAPAPRPTPRPHTPLHAHSACTAPTRRPRTSPALTAPPSPALVRPPVLAPRWATRRRLKGGATRTLKPLPVFAALRASVATAVVADFAAAPARRSSPSPPPRRPVCHRHRDRRGRHSSRLWPPTPPTPSLPAPPPPSPPLTPPLSPWGRVGGR